MADVASLSAFYYHSTSHTKNTAPPLRLGRGAWAWSLVYTLSCKNTTGISLPTSPPYQGTNSNGRDVGFLRYWKVSNIPLFLLAAPALVILLCSGLRTVDLISRETTRPSHKVDHYKVTPAERALSQRTIRILRSLAYPQLVLAVLAITNYHVQIITRLASASPVWYLWLAHSLVDAGQSDGKAKARGRWSGWEKGVVMYMVMYGLIQAVLFASFLPPA